MAPVLNLLSSEWTKLRSTASFYWTTGLILAGSAFFAAVFSFPAGGAFYIPLTVIAAVGMISAIIVIVQSAMVVTTEYRFGVHPTNFRIAPKRWQVALAKLVLYAVLAGVTVLIACALALAIGDALAAVPVGWTTNPVTARALWAVPLGAVLLVAFTQGVGWMVRNTAGAVTLVFGLQFVAEAVVGLIPRVGREIVQYMPFTNLFAFMYNTPTQHHGVGTSLAIFAVWALAAWVAGVALLQSRDV